MSRMRFGIFTAPFHPVPQNPTLALERDLEPWMDPVEDGDALVWTEIPYVESEIKFGINFMRAAY